MKHLAISAISIVSATLVAAGLQVAPQQQEGTESIAGIAFQSDTKAPLPQTRLELVREDYARLPTGHEKPCKPDSDMETTDRRQFATTDANGKFTFTGIVPGSYYLFAEREGFLRFAYGQRGQFPIPVVLKIGIADDSDLFAGPSAPPEPGASNPLSTTPLRGGMGRDAQGLRGGAPSALRDGTQELAGAASAIGDSGKSRLLLQNIEIGLTPAPTIAGAVFDEQGAPLAAASVQAYQFRYTPLNGRSLKAVRAALTSDEGKYRLFWLNPGRYVVAAGYSDYGLQPWTQGLSLTPNLPNADSGYPISFYPASTTAPNAIVVPLNPGAKPVADFRLRSRPRLTAGIRLTGDRVPANASLLFVPAGGDLCAGADYGIRALRDGTFEIRDVPEGIYVAAAMSGRDFISDLVTMKIESGATNQTSIPVVPPTLLRGNIYVDAPGGDQSELRVNLTRAGQELRQVATAIADPATGRFVIPGLGPGSYYPTVDLPPGLYVDDVQASKFYPNGEDCRPDLGTPQYSYMDQHGHLDRQQPFLIPQTIPQAADCLVIRVKMGSPMMGFVQDSRKRPISSAFVVAIPKGVWEKSGDGGVTPPDRILTATSDGTGRFELRGATEFLNPRGIRQAYHLYAFEEIDPNLIYSPGFTDLFLHREIFVIAKEVRESPLEAWKEAAGSIATEAYSDSCDQNGILLRTRCYLTVIPASDIAEIR